jgi:predicted ATP-grasp superfamily ATP-dependent carboligase
MISVYECMSVTYMVIEKPVLGAGGMVLIHVHYKGSCFY